MKEGKSSKKEEEMTHIVEETRTTNKKVRNPVIMLK